MKQTKRQHTDETSHAMDEQEFVVDAEGYWKPVEIDQGWRNINKLSSSCKKSGCSVLHFLKFGTCRVRQSCKHRVAIV